MIPSRMPVNGTPFRRENSPRNSVGGQVIDHPSFCDLVRFRGDGLTEPSFKSTAEEVTDDGLGDGQIAHVGAIVVLGVGGYWCGVGALQ